MTLTANPEINAPTTGQEFPLTALLRGAGVANLDDTGWIRVTGNDRVRWLNGMTTNSVQGLGTGAGNYSFFLNAQGRIQGDGYIFAAHDSLLIETGLAYVPGLIALLDRFVIMDDVELADISSTHSGALLAGPAASSLLEQLGIHVADLEEIHRKTVSWNSFELAVLRGYGPLVPRFELWASPVAIASIRAKLSELGSVSCSPESIEQLRILEGTPRFGVDIRDRELPQETMQDRALHFAKGCYLGQEIVERIRSRGNVHRTFGAFRLEGALPAAGTALTSDGKQIGELTTVGTIPLPQPIAKPIQLALGYVRREAIDRSEAILYEGGIAVPVTVPIAIAEAT